MQEHLPAIVRSVWQQRALILVAEPGSGKTTQVPWALNIAQHAPGHAAPKGQVLVLEPRRLAARMAAHYVARLQGEAVGQRIGYRVRHEDATSRNTEVIYMTEGLLFRTLLGQPHLPGVSCVVFDEFHGRSLTGDLILAALLHRRRAGGGGPAVVVMSATLAHEAVHQLLPEAEVMHVPGRQFPVTITHVSQASTDRLEQQVARGVAQVLQQSIGQNAQAAGHILTFLPGTADIDRAQKACAGVALRHKLQVAPLHASLSPAEQDAAVAPSRQRRLILATNVAETSLTIDGVTHVIDSGLAKLAEVDPMTGIGRLQTGPISQAAAVQRAGRAGRTGPGHCLRLFTAVNMQRRAAHAPPEILRQDLSEAVLWLGAQNLPPLGALGLIDRPSAEAVARAEATLQRLGAMHDGRITALGHELLQMAVHPRLGRMVLAANSRGIGPLGCRAAAVLSLGHRGPKPGARSGQGPAAGEALGHSDLEPLIEPRALSHEAKQVVKALQAGLRNTKSPTQRSTAPEAVRGDPMELLEEALLLGFSDRLVRRMPPVGPRPGALPLALGWGGKGTLSAHSCVRESTLMLALAAGERGERSIGVTVDIAHGVAPESLLMLDDGRLQETSEVAVSTQHGRVEKVETLRYDQLVVHETHSQNVSAEEAQQALSAWIQSNQTTLLNPLTQEMPYVQLLARLICIKMSSKLGPLYTSRRHDDDSGPPVPVEQQLRDGALAVLMEASASCRSVKQLQELPLMQLLQSQLSGPWQQALQRGAPTHVTLGSGRKVPVQYTVGQAPHVASYLQDFFGSSEGPSLGSAQQPLTLHLWGPNRQALQVTQDLASFWRQHYPKLRQALARRYPRHLWPVDPVATTPPPPRGKNRH